ncbi:hypothetical protein PDQ75_24810 [Bacillus cereus group sp. Bc015]|uniref:hypothetical protein n=1 Tax=Bacillus cereus group sp. Bc015 TaxID=3018123 RepID=UPI0022E3D022|nr:hypothetical protein [Bacillus cereus group sp. Bc015]MDA2738379.1 hypothetical protein [Bacillus cereus group sp. Bc015]
MAKVKINGFNKNMKKIEKAVFNASLKTMKFAMQDLERVASETTPYDEGDLEMGGFHDVDVEGKEIVGWVGFEAWNDNPNRSYDFNYAIWTHEETYNLGEGSRQKGGGRGLSGKSYPVGNKYLTRPLEGESPFYRNKIEQEVKKTLR